MPIQFPCTCGQILSVDDAHAEMTVQCPQCGAPVPAPAAGYPSAGSQPLQYAGGGAAAHPGGPIAPPPSDYIRIPHAVPPKYAAPGLPRLFLSITAQGAMINAGMDISPALDALVEAIAKPLYRQFDVQIVQGPPPAAPCASLRLVTIDEGNRWLRYFFGLFAGKTTFEIEGDAVTASGQRVALHEKHRGALGLFGGASINLLKVSAKVAGKRIAKKLMR